MDEEKLKRLQGWVAEARRIVFFGGAGVSTESGIPDFRGVDGLYSQKFSDPPETIISHTYYLRKPEVFFEFYRTLQCDSPCQTRIIRTLSKRRYFRAFWQILV